MKYLIKTIEDPKIVYPRDFRSIGTAFEKAVDLLGYMDIDTEMLICNELEVALYSVKYLGRNEFKIKDLNQ